MLKIIKHTTFQQHNLCDTFICLHAGKTI